MLVRASPLSCSTPDRNLHLEAELAGIYTTHHALEIRSRPNNHNAVGLAQTTVCSASFAGTDRAKTSVPGDRLCKAVITIGSHIAWQNCRPAPRLTFCRFHEPHFKAEGMSLNRAFTPGFVQRDQLSTENDRLRACRRRFQSVRFVRYGAQELAGGTRERSVWCRRGYTSTHPEQWG